MMTQQYEIESDFELVLSNHARVIMTAMLDTDRHTFVQVRNYLSELLTKHGMLPADASIIEVKMAS